MLLQFGEHSTQSNRIGKGDHFTELKPGRFVQVFTSGVVHIKQNCLIVKIVPVEIDRHSFAFLVFHCHCFQLKIAFLINLFQLIVPTRIIKDLSFHAKLHQKHTFVELEYKFFEPLARLNNPQQAQN
jgi:hypothetical protein